MFTDIDSATLRDYIVSIAAIITAVAASYGLGSWRHELKGKADFDVARGLMRAVYKVRKSMEMCRDPFISIVEYPEKYQSRNHLAPIDEAKAYRHVFRNRWNRVLDSIQELDSQFSEAKILWDNDMNLQKSELYECLKELNFAIDAFIKDKMSSRGDFQKDPKYGEEMTRMVFAEIDPKDEFSKRFAEVIAGIECEMRSYLKRR